MCQLLDSVYNWISESRVGGVGVGAGVSGIGGKVGGRGAGAVGDNVLFVPASTPTATRRAREKMEHLIFNRFLRV